MAAVSNPFTFTITKNMTASASTAVSTPKGTLVSTSGSVFTAPAGVSYVSINVLYQELVKDGKYGYWQYGCAVRRLAVAAGATYSGYNNMSGYNAGYTYAAGVTTYYNHPQLGAIPSSALASLYRVYADDGLGTPFIDADIRARYTWLTGGSLPA